MTFGQYSDHYCHFGGFGVGVCVERVMGGGGSRADRLTAVVSSRVTITGVSCHKCHFCHEKTFVMTNTSSVVTKVCLLQQKFYHDKHTFVTTKDMFCHDKHMFVTTKVSFVHNKIMFVATKVLTQQAYFCCNKRRVLS